MLSPLTEVALNDKRIVKKLRLDLLPFLLEKRDEEYTVQNPAGKITFKNNSPRVTSPIFTVKGASLLRQVGGLQLNNTTHGIIGASPPCNSARTNGSMPLKMKVVQSSIKPKLHVSESMTYKNNDMGLLNYNIKSSITRTDPVHQRNIEKIRQRRAQRDKPSLSVALVSRNIIKARTTNSQYYLHQLSARTGHGTIPSCQYDNNSTNRYKTPLSSRIRSKFIDKPSSTKKPIKEKEETLQDRNIFAVLRWINNEQKNELSQNKKVVFKQLKIDIKKNEFRVKNMLDDLKRTQILNDEDLKKKKFITKPNTTKVESR